MRNIIENINKIELFDKCIYLNIPGFIRYLNKIIHL